MTSTSKPRTCDANRPLISALVDGALNPIEAVDVRRHVDECPSCRLERNNIEQLKLRVHVAGRDLEPSTKERVRWEQALGSGASPEPATWRLSFAAAAVVVLGMLSLSAPPSPENDVATVSEALQGQPIALNSEVLTRLVAVQRGKAELSSLGPLKRSGVLETFELLPGSFIAPNSGVEPAAASFVDCDPGSTAGSALAVLHASQLALAPDIELALETSGVYVDVIDNTELKLTRGGDNVFVLLRPIEPLSVGI